MMNHTRFDRFSKSLLEREDMGLFLSTRLASAHAAHHGNALESSVVDLTTPHAKQSYLPLSTDNGHIALFLSSKLTELSHSPKSEDSRDHAYKLAQMVAPTLS
jgi:hypothetical protein